MIFMICDGESRFDDVDNIAARIRGQTVGLGIGAVLDDGFQLVFLGFGELGRAAWLRPVVETVKPFRVGEIP